MKINELNCIDCYLQYKQTKVMPECQALMPITGFECFYHKIAIKDLDQVAKYNLRKEYAKAYDGKVLTTFDVEHLLMNDNKNPEVRYE